MSGFLFGRYIHGEYPANGSFVFGSREKALKDLLARSGPKLDDWMTRALVGSLKLPMTWVDEAKVRMRCCRDGERRDQKC